MPSPELAMGEGGDSTAQTDSRREVGVVDARPEEQNGRHTATELTTRPRSFKLIAGAVFAMLLIASVGVYQARGGRPAAGVPAKRVMLAILPFQNMSNDPRQEYFGDGLTEETITDLGELSPERLGVIARTSAMADKRTNKTVHQIGQELGVDYILEGSVRREGGRARVTAQLIRVSDQTHLWARSYDRDSTMCLRSKTIWAGPLRRKCRLT